MVVLVRIEVFMVVLMIEVFMMVLMIEVLGLFSGPACTSYQQHKDPVQQVILQLLPIPSRLCSHLSNRINL